MPPNLCLIASPVEESFRRAQGCPVAMDKWGHGEYLAHQGNPDSFLLADAAVKDGSASVRLVLWRCVYCNILLAGLAPADGDPGIGQAFTWAEQVVTELSV